MKKFAIYTPIQSILSFFQLINRIEASTHTVLGTYDIHRLIGELNKALAAELPTEFEFNFTDRKIQSHTNPPTTTVKVELLPLPTQ